MTEPSHAEIMKIYIDVNMLWHAVSMIWYAYIHDPVYRILMCDRYMRLCIYSHA